MMAAAAAPFRLAGRGSLERPEFPEYFDEIVMEGGTSATGAAPGDVVAGKYRLEAKIGEGGMGAVFVATHIELGEKVAIKVLLPAAAKNDATQKRFLREARALVRLKDEHVVRAIDIGRLDSGVPFMVMELLDGHDLGKLSERELAITEVVGLVLQALRGVAEAHAANIIHRDLKPANLFLTRRRDGSTCVKVLDFGISKSTSDLDPSALTQTSSIIGSPMFMAPEQWLAAKDIDARADVWAMGAILFQLLAGRAPFEGGTVAQLCTAVLHKPPASLRALRPDVPPALESAILACLAKDRDARHADVGALARALEPFASEDDTPIVASIRGVLHGAGMVDAPAAVVPVAPLSEVSPTAVTETSITTTRSIRSRIGLAAVGAVAIAAVAVALLHARVPSPAPAVMASVSVEPSVLLVPPPVAPSPAAAAESAAPAAGSVTPDKVAVASAIASPPPPRPRPVVVPVTSTRPEPAITAPAAIVVPPPAASSASRSDLGGRH